MLSSYLFMELLNIFILMLVLLVWPALSIIALFSLRTCRLDSVAQVLWTALIIAVPFLGAISYWIVKPGSKSDPV